MKKIYSIFFSLLMFGTVHAQFPAPYCAEIFPDGVEPITSVKLGTINNTSGAATGGIQHENFTTMNTSLVAGSSYTIEVKGNTDGNYSDGVCVFFDFNNDGDFTDNGERFVVGTIENSTGVDAIVASASITIPSTTPTGAVRMRVVKAFDFIPFTCDVFNDYGQAEDYTVTITAPACAFPTNLDFSNVSIPNATITWSAAAGVTAYQYAITTSATPPASGTATAALTGTVSGLPANTTLYAYVRSACTGGLFTAWVSKSYVPNDSCGAPIFLAPDVPVTGSNIGATQSYATVLCDGFTSPSPVVDVWYYINAWVGGNATVALTNATGGLDAVLVAYSGTCATLTPVACADATIANGNETLALTGLVAGAPYLIRVYGYNTSSGGVTQGSFTITSSGPALPVSGLVLAGTRNGGTVRLNWKTLTETNNAGFELQRSADGRTFSSILDIASKANGGNSTTAIDYHVNDTKPFSGAGYYRLKQSDKDGKTNFSNVVFVKGAVVSNLTISAIYPNPTMDVLKVSLQAPNAESITFVLTDIIGKVVGRQVSAVNAGDNLVTLDVARLPSGNYLLRAICHNGCGTTVQKFSKQ